MELNPLALGGAGRGWEECSKSAQPVYSDPSDAYFSVGSIIEKEVVKYFYNFKTLTAI